MKHFDDTQYTGNPDYNWEEEPGQEGIMETYEPYIDMVLEVANTDPTKVWTIIEGETADLVIVAGYHLVSRFQYFISNESWVDENEEYIWG